MFLFGTVAFIISADTIGRVGEPDTAIRVRHSIIWRVQWFTFIAISDNRNIAIVLIAHYPPTAVFAGNLPSLMIKSITIAIARRVTKFSDPIIILNPAQLSVIGYITPHHITPNTIPGRALSPHGAYMMALNGGVKENIASKSWI